MWKTTNRKDREEEDAHRGESSLMQNGLQFGDIAEDEIKALEDLRIQLERVRAKNNGKGKGLLFIVKSMVTRNTRRLLPAMRQVCQGLREVLNG